MNPLVGVVVIGRNEGERLRRCFMSVRSIASSFVYVDSGSTDGSIELAREMDIEVVQLDIAIPFTAARARNEGFAGLVGVSPEVEYVQFVDGDCEVVPGWMENALAFLVAQPKIAVVCGRRRERYPERSIYNLLCDLEWDTPIGEAKACGGDAMMRVKALTGVSGYRADLIAGEEPELCVRLRAAGWQIWRLDEEMTLHDAAMTRFSQWWKRSMRGGHAYAEGAFLHGGLPEKHGVSESRRAWLWAVGVPAVTAVMMLVSGWWGGLVLAVYPLQIFRLAMRGRRSLAINWIQAFFLVLAKFPEVVGQCKFLVRQRFGGSIKLIEYK